MRGICLAPVGFRTKGLEGWIVPGGGRVQVRGRDRVGPAGTGISGVSRMFGFGGGWRGFNPR